MDAQSQRVHVRMNYYCRMTALSILSFARHSAQYKYETFAIQV
jgi:hypothetical protein